MYPEFEFNAACHVQARVWSAALWRCRADPNL